MRNVRIITIIPVLLVSICISGCGDKFFDPTQVGRFRPVPAVNVILDSLGVAEETPSTWEGAEEPRPVDTIVSETDYVFGRGDVARISIFELLQEGLASTNDYIVTETGKISIPEVGVVEAAGLTESQLEEEIKQILSPGILKEPSVTVSLLTSQQRSFSILGSGIPKPDRYSIPRYDFRLNDALATAGGISQFNTSYIYVSRPVTGKEAITEPVKPAAAEPNAGGQEIKPEQDMMEIIAPRAARQGAYPADSLVVTSAEMVTDKELAEVALPGNFEPSADNDRNGTDALAISQTQTTAGPAGRETVDEPIKQNETGRIEWVFQNGKWIPVQIGGTGPAKSAVKAGPTKMPVGAPGLKEKLPAQFDWEQTGTGGAQTRVIKIDTDKLSGGDPRYNIIIKPGDIIQVPVDIIGEFYIMGNTNNQGYINLTGRPMTLKMAIAAAAGLGPLAWPKNCEVIRRIGKKKEEIVMVDLDRIASGEQPDFFIKPNDLVNVGTHPAARWLAVLRNAFRATYGFGFIYDRNFADYQYGNPFPKFLR